MKSLSAALAIITLTILGAVHSSRALAMPEKGYGMTGLSNISVAGFEAILKSRDTERIAEVVEAIRWRYPMVNDPMYPFLRDLWEGKGSSQLDPEGALNDERIRINIAYTLLQAWGGGDVELDPRGILRFVRNSLRSDNFLSPDNFDVKHAAIGALRFIESDGVVRDLYEMAAREDPRTFYHVAVVLLHKCSQAATDAVARLNASIRNPKFRTHMRKTKADLDAFNRNPRLCPRVCNECE